MSTHINVAEDFKKFCDQLDFDINLENYKEQLMDWQKVNNLIVLRDQFFYINDFTTASNIFIHPYAEEITGYPPEEFLDFTRIYYLIHPDDRDFVYEFSKRSISFGQLYKKELLENPYLATFSIDFRLKHKKGHYIRLNRQTSCFKTDREGNMVLAFVLFTDISHLKKSEGISISWYGDPKDLFYFDDLVKKYRQDYRITNREKDILTLLSSGDSATKIAKKMNLSVHTVISHRRNLLKKTRTRNTAELVKLAIEKSLI